MEKWTHYQEEKITEWNSESRNHDEGCRKPRESQIELKHQHEKDKKITVQEARHQRWQIICAGAESGENPDGQEDIEISQGLEDKTEKGRRQGE